MDLCVVDWTLGCVDVPSSVGPAMFRAAHSARVLRTVGSMSAATSPSDPNVVPVSAASEDRSLATCELHCAIFVAPPRVRPVVYAPSWGRVLSQSEGLAGCIPSTAAPSTTITGPLDMALTDGLVRV